jgi:hypothetical protein
VSKRGWIKKLVDLWLNPWGKKKMSLFPDSLLQDSRNLTEEKLNNLDYLLHLEVLKFFEI